MTAPVAGPWAHGINVAAGVVLHALEWTPAGGGDGSAPDLLLVHGLASNAQLWTGMAQALAELGHRVVAVDQRGHGLSSKVDDGYDDQTLTDDLLAVVDALALHRPIAVGQSWGGNVVLELGIRHPDRVAGLACIDGGQIELSRAFPDEETMLATLRPPPLAGLALEDIRAGMRSWAGHWPETGINGQLANFMRFPDGTIAPHLTLERHLTILGHMWRHHPTQRFADAAVPVLLLPVEGGPQIGTDMKRAAIAEAERLLPRSRTHWFTGSHDIHAEAPLRVTAVLRAAIAEHFFDTDDENRPGGRP